MAGYCRLHKASLPDLLTSKNLREWSYHKTPKAEPKSFTGIAWLFHEVLDIFRCLTNISPVTDVMNSGSEMSEDESNVDEEKSGRAEWFRHDVDDAMADK